MQRKEGSGCAPSRTYGGIKSGARFMRAVHLFRSICKAEGRSDGVNAREMAHRSRAAVFNATFYRRDAATRGAAASRSAGDMSLVHRFAIVHAAIEACDRPRCH